MNLSEKPLAMAYVPWQQFENVLEAECGLEQGTIFEDLIFPFIGSQAACQSVRRGNGNPAPCPCQRNASYGRRGGYQ
jgi:hypothetical protein